MIVIDGFSHHNIVIGNTCGKSRADGLRSGNFGIHVAGWSNVVRNNTITNLWSGLHIELNGTDNMISNNTISYNEVGLAMVARAPSSNLIAGNNIIGNGRIYSGGGNARFYLNNFINNTQIDGTSGFWSYEEITYSHNGVIYVNYLGNYWNDYVGNDSDGDGIGETPFVINNDNNSDNYSLMNPWTCDFKPWDINTDGKVDIIDVAIVAKHFMFRRDESNRDDRYDLDSDGSIDIIDLTIVARHYGEITVTLDRSNDDTGRMEKKQACYY